MGVMQSFGGNCVIIAGGGYMNVTNGSEIANGTLDYVPGTVVVATIQVPAGGVRIMATVALSNLSGKSVLITRPAARDVAPAMQAASRDGTITLDTSGILRIGVSFFDEALLVFQDIISETGNADLRLVYRKAPTMQSLKRLAHNRGFALSETSSGEWVISRSGLR